VPPIVTEFFVAYLYAPFALLSLCFGLLITIFDFATACFWGRGAGRPEETQSFGTRLAFRLRPCQQHTPASAPAAANDPVQRQPPDADAYIVMYESLDVEGIPLEVQGMVRKLQELKRLLSEGLVTMEEYKRRRSAVLECAGCDCASLKAAGFDVKVLKSAGFSADMLKQAELDCPTAKFKKTDVIQASAFRPKQFTHCLLFSIDKS
jgi:hypothetical protein